MIFNGCVFNYVCEGRKHVRVRTSACRVQKWVSDPLELGSEAAVAAVGAGLDLGPPLRAAHALDAEPSLQTCYFSSLEKVHFTPGKPVHS